jgi:hypothetical protein
MNFPCSILSLLGCLAIFTPSMFCLIPIHTPKALTLFYVAYTPALLEI